MRKAVNDFTVIENTALNATSFIIRLKSPISLPVLYPGQFVNVKVDKTDKVFLRRPFSIFEADYSTNTLSLIIKILGKGSKILTGLEAGEKLSLVYPLGNGFTQPSANDKILLIGGGSGVAPMLFLAKTSGIEKNNIDIILGARSSEDVIDIQEYYKYGNVHITTEDGSKGAVGRVTDHPLFKNGLSKYNKVYTCGPEPMMKAIGKAAKKESIFCEVSLENLMACGFGVCLCCIEPTNKGNQCVCTNGPVFNINSLKW